MTSVTSADIHHFDEMGYVVIRDLLDYEYDIQPVIAEYEELLGDLANRWKSAGHADSTFEGMPFGQRLISLVRETKQPYDLEFDISLPQADVTESTPMHHGPAVFELIRSPRLLNVVEQFIGPEIYSNPVQHVRVKVPEHLMPEEIRTGLTARIDWHQDLGVITSDADSVDLLTVWFPITEATLENGCLAVIPRSHQGELQLHCRSRNPLTLNQVAIPNSLVSDDQVPLPMQPADVLFMHRRTQHSGLVNKSDDIRWSLDLRYQKIGEPTGRKWFPGFVARSRSRPETELHDATEWSRLWQHARSRLAAGDDVNFNRWTNTDPGCA
jgi:ectoine hydroxylase-related dioxygenase (phytanoyl-CoA dioxygenase family)